MEARLEAVPGAEKVFDFGTQSYADPKVGAQIARRAARRQDAAAALARVQAAQHLVGAELSAGCWEQDGKFLLLLGTRKGCWLRTVYREDGPGLWLLDMIRRAACRSDGSGKGILDDGSCCSAFGMCQECYRYGML